MNQEIKTAEVFKALCDVTRVKILKRLQSGEKCACDLIEHLGILQSALSYHMKILCTSGIVESWNVGKWMHYRISETGSAYAKQLLCEITSVTSKECSCEK